MHKNYIVCQTSNIKALKIFYFISLFSFAAIHEIESTHCNWINIFFRTNGEKCGGNTRYYCHRSILTNICGNFYFINSTIITWFRAFIAAYTMMAFCSISLCSSWLEIYMYFYHCIDISLIFQRLPVPQTYIDSGNSIQFSYVWRIGVFDSSLFAIIVKITSNLLFVISFFKDSRISYTYAS
jgi:hypothetical protein